MHSLISELSNFAPPPYSTFFRNWRDQKQQVYDSSSSLESFASCTIYAINNKYRNVYLILKTRWRWQKELRNYSQFMTLQKIPWLVQGIRPIYTWQPIYDLDQPSSQPLANSLLTDARVYTTCVDRQSWQVSICWWQRFLWSFACMHVCVDHLNVFA
jgi:hypothetical protein